MRSLWLIGFLSTAWAILDQQVVFSNLALANHLERTSTCVVGWLADDDSSVVLCTLSRSDRVEVSSRLEVAEDRLIKPLRLSGEEGTPSTLASPRMALAVAGWRADRVFLQKKAQSFITEHMGSLKTPPKFGHTSSQIADWLHDFCRNPGTRPLVVSCLAAGVGRDVGSAQLCQIGNDGSLSHVRVGVSWPVSDLSFASTSASSSSSKSNSNPSSEAAPSTDSSSTSSSGEQRDELKALLKTVLKLQTIHTHTQTHTQTQTQSPDSPYIQQIKDSLKGTAWPHVREILVLSVNSPPSPFAAVAEK